MDENTFLQEEVINEVPQNEESPAQEIESNDNSRTYSPNNRTTDQERNFAALREKAFKAERERDEALRYVREMEAKKQQQIEPDDIDVSLGDDEIAEGKHLKSVAQQIKYLKNEIKKYKQESLTSTVETKIRSQYPDFDNVVSKENLESLRNIHPEIVQTLMTATDPYSQAASAYTIIKKLGIDNQGSYEMDKQRVQVNAQKPKPLSSIATQQGGKGALSHANAFAGGLTKELQAQLLKEMQESRKSF